MWGVDYALDDECLLKIFKEVKSNSSEIIVAAVPTITSNSMYLTCRVLISNCIRLLFSRSRYIGKLRFFSYFKYLADKCGVKMIDLGTDGKYVYYLFR